MALRLSYTVGHMTEPSTAPGRLALAEEAERLGYTNVWVAEAYGSDAPAVLSWIAARTTRVGIGASVMQIPGRSPAMTAMTAATLDLLSGGRFLLGLGISGPQVSEGWHGVRFDDPLGRTREYLDVVRKVLSRQPVTNDGEHYPLPLPGGPGKPLRLTVRSRYTRVPIYLAATGPRNLELAGAVADGWLAVFLSPEFAADQLAHIQAGLDSAGRTRADFRVVASLPVAVGDDVEQCAGRVRAHTALYLGGMGSRRQNFYNRLAIRMGFAEEARRVQDLYLDRRYAEAAAAVPFEFLDRTALLGPADRIARRLREYADAGVDEVTVTPFGHAAAALRAVREAFPDANAQAFTDPA